MTPGKVNWKRKHSAIAYASSVLLFEPSKCDMGTFPIEYTTISKYFWIINFLSKFQRIHGVFWQIIVVIYLYLSLFTLKMRHLYPYLEELNHALMTVIFQPSFKPNQSFVPHILEKKEENMELHVPIFPRPWPQHYLDPRSYLCKINYWDELFARERHISIYLDFRGYIFKISQTETKQRLQPDQGHFANVPSPWDDSSLHQLRFRDYFWIGDHSPLHYLHGHGIQRWGYQRMGKLIFAKILTP